MENKRKSVRVIASLVASYKIKDTLLAGGSRVKDISETGVRILSKHNFPAGSLLELDIRLGDFKEPIKALARVMRVTHRNVRQFPFEVGLVFLNLPTLERDKLQDYIRCSMAQGRE